MITSLSNAKVKLVRGLQSRRSVRYREKLLVAEGTRLVQEALLAAPICLSYGRLGQHPGRGCHVGIFGRVGRSRSTGQRQSDGWLY